MHKKLGKFDIFALVIGSIIGWGSFFLPGKKFLATSGVINTILGLLVGAVLISIIQKSYHIMLDEHEEEGGEFTYVYRNFGKLHGFIVGWSLSLCYLSMIPLNSSAFVLLLKAIFKDQFSVGYLYTIAGYDVFITDVLLMSFIIILFAYINIKGLKVSSNFQNVMSFLLVFIIAVILFLVFIKSDLEVFNNNYIKNNDISFSQMFTVVAIVPFLFVGFDVVPQVSRDLKFNASKATRLTVATIFVGALIYGALNLIAGLSFSPKEALQTNWAVADSIMLKLGSIGFYFMLIALFAAITGGINGFMLASSKLISALGEYKILDKKYKIKNKNDVYANSIIFVTLVSLIAPWIGREVIIYIVDMASLLAAVAYGYVCLVSAKKSKTKLDKILTILGCVISLGFVYLLVSPFSISHLSLPSLWFLLCWILLGTIYYRLSRKYK